MGLNESMNEVQKYMDEIPELIREAQKNYLDNFKI